MTRGDGLSDCNDHDYYCKSGLVIHISSIRAVHKDTIPSHVTFNVTHSPISSKPGLYNLTVFIFRDNSVTCYVVNSLMRTKNMIKS